MSIKGIIASFLLSVIIIQQNVVITEFKSNESEDYLWEILIEESPNEYIAAGILAFFWRESYYRSDAVTHWANVKAINGIDPGNSFTQQLDKANRDEFVDMVRQAGGYGLGQWHAITHLESLYDFCKGYNTTFADARMQCLFTIHCCVNDPYIWDTLKDARNAREAGKIISYLHDGSEAGAETIASVAQKIYRERVK